MTNAIPHHEYKSLRTIFTEFGGSNKPRLTLEDFTDILILDEDHFEASLGTLDGPFHCIVEIHINGDGQSVLVMDQPDSDVKEFVVAAKLKKVITKHQDMLIQAFAEVKAARDEAFLGAEDFSSIEGCDENDKFSIAFESEGKQYSGIVQVKEHKNPKGVKYLHLRREDNRHMKTLEFSAMQAIIREEEDFIVGLIADRFDIDTAGVPAMA